VPPRGNLVVGTRLPMNRQYRIKVSSAEIAGSGRETRCDTGRLVFGKKMQMIEGFRLGQPLRLVNASSEAVPGHHGFDCFV
jgi:hypothetical protein